MSAYDEHDNDEANGPKALREALEKANKRIAELEKSNTDLSSQVSKFSLDRILSDKKVPAKAVKYLKKDDVEPTAEAVDKWLAENGADFGWNPGAAQEASEGSSPEEAPAQGQQAPQQSVLPPEVQAAYETLQSALSGSSGAPSQPLDAMIAATEQIASQDLSLEDTIAALRAAGVPMA